MCFQIVDVCQLVDCDVWLQLELLDQWRSKCSRMSFESRTGLFQMTTLDRSWRSDFAAGVSFQPWSSRLIKLMGSGWVSQRHIREHCTSTHRGRAVPSRKNPQTSPQV